jgi:hypothetical protein
MAGLAGLIILIALMIMILNRPQQNSRPRQNIFEAGNQLHARFASLGAMTGRSLRDVEAIVGPPNSISSLGGGRVLYQWQRTGYHVALIFKDDFFEQVSHEYSA